MQEEWRAISEYEGIYEVSNFGRIRGLERINARGYRQAGKILSPGSRIGGYQFVGLCKNRKVKIVSVHGLVARAFIGERPVGQEINHKDGDPANNHLDNLEYVTHQENIRHAQITGLFGKLSAEDVRDIRDLVRRFPRINLSAIAKEKGVKRETIGNIVRCYTYNLIPNNDGSVPLPIERRLTVEKIFALQMQGMNLTQVARHLGYEDSAAHQVVRRAKLKSRGQQ